MVGRAECALGSRALSLRSFSFAKSSRGGWTTAVQPNDLNYGPDYLENLMQQGPPNYPQESQSSCDLYLVIFRLVVLPAGNRCEMSARNPFRQSSCVRNWNDLVIC